MLYSIYRLSRYSYFTTTNYEPKLRLSGRYTRKVLFLTPPPQMSTSSSSDNNDGLRHETVNRANLSPKKSKLNKKRNLVYAK
jgi:hypothetical protein